MPVENRFGDLSNCASIIGLLIFRPNKIRYDKKISRIPTLMQRIGNMPIVSQTIIEGE